MHLPLSRRALPLAGERFAEDVLRSVVSSYFLHGRSSDAAPFERSRELVAKGIAVRTPGSDLGPARELLAAIRQSAPDDLPSIVANLVQAGAAASTLWDAVVIAACEITVANPGIGPLHALTSTNSLHYIARQAPSERVALLALLQSAAWVARFRRGMSPEEAALRIDAVEPAESTMEAILVDGPRDMQTVRGAAWLAEHEFGGFIERAQQVARTKCDDVHEFKPAAAGLEEARVAGRWARPAVCAALAVHLPAPKRADSARFQRINDAMEVASAR